MHTHSRSLLLSLSAALVVVALPPAARAQVLDPIRVTERRVKADKLDADARAFEEKDWSQLKKAALLRERAAELRAVDDPIGTVSLYWAARDRYYSGQPKAARALMEAAGDRALVLGDVVNAATAYTEAAYISADIRDRKHARALASKARLLATSPMLSEAQRDQLRTRLLQGYAPVGVVAAMTKP
jgi:hypothetical protein